MNINTYLDIRQMQINELVANPAQSDLPMPAPEGLGQSKSVRSYITQMLQEHDFGYIVSHPDKRTEKIFCLKWDSRRIEYREKNGGHKKSFRCVFENTGFSENGKEIDVQLGYCKLAEIFTFVLGEMSGQRAVLCFE